MPWVCSWLKHTCNCFCLVMVFIILSKSEQGVPLAKMAHLSKWHQDTTYHVPTQHTYNWNYDDDHGSVDQVRSISTDSIVTMFKTGTLASQIVDTNITSSTAGHNLIFLFYVRMIMISMYPIFISPVSLLTTKCTHGLAGWGKLTHTSIGQRKCFTFWWEQRTNLWGKAGVQPMSWQGEGGKKEETTE